MNVWEKFCYVIIVANFIFEKVKIVKTLKIIMIW